MATALLDCGIPFDVLKRPLFQRMLGYSIHPPFIGQVDGMHPKRLLEPGAQPL